MAKKKYKGKSRASIEAEKKKSLSDIEKTRRKLQAIEGRELESKRLSAKDMIELNKAIQDLDKNKALIEDTPRGTPGQKVSTWTRKSKVNKSKIW
jgi:replicative DNA helicase